MNKNTVKTITALLVTSSVALANGAVEVEAKTQNINVIQNNVAVYVNNQLISQDNIIYEGTTYLPLRAVSESLGLDVEYIASTKRVNVAEGGVVKMTTMDNRKTAKNLSWDVDINSLEVYANGEEVTADNILYKGVTYLPLRAVGEATGTDVDYAGSTKTVYLYTSDYMGSRDKIEVPEASDTVQVGSGSSVDPDGLLNDILGIDLGTAEGSGSVVLPKGY